MLSNFVINLLSERSISLLIDDNNKISRLVWRGLPQGSVLSPLLYNIYTSDLEASLNGTVSVLQYADDLLLYSSNLSPEQASRSVTSSLGFLKSWLDSNGLELSVPKSVVVLFTRKLFPPPIKVQFDNYSISVKVKTKFLGVILDSKLTGLPHCEYIVSKCEKNINILRCVSGVWWGSHPFCMKLMYNALIRSILDYGTFLLEPGYVAGFQKLDRIQSKALRIICGAMNSSPINAMQVECAEPPLHLRRQYLCDRFLFRCSQFSNHQLWRILSNLLLQITTSNYWTHKSPPCLIKSFQKFKSISAPTVSSSTLPIFQHEYESLTLVPPVLLNIGISKNDIEQNQQFLGFIGTDCQDANHMYTDASKMSVSGCVGIGVLHIQSNIYQKIKLPPESSVYSGECFGILKALEFIIIMHLKKTIIFSDSLSSLQAISKIPFKSKSNNPIIYQIRSLLLKCHLKGYSVSIAWIPGHRGIKGNERVDELARDAIICGDMFPFKNVAEDLLALPKLFLRKEWTKQWTSGTGTASALHYRSIQSSIPIKPWFAKISLSKPATSMLIRMRLGHVCTPQHLKLQNRVASSACICGADPADLNHIFFACSLNDCSSLLRQLSDLKVPFPTSITSLLHINDSSPDIFKVLYSFLSRHNIKL
ncbi:uncharacterized protein LOC134748295 [Cydia strobilella]|uniref:uncharacterized protein LOC134748295 n=1 Tax=Cydia strobilella TaxID=1100964 RepID=UPI003005B566